MIATYRKERYYDNTEVSICFTAADTFWSAFFFVACIAIFFVVPFIILVLLYAAIVYKLMRRNTDFQRPTSPRITTTTPTTIVSLSGSRHLRMSGVPHTAPGHKMHQHNHQLSSGMRKSRKQVIFMLVTVVASFFVCLLPFRAFTLWVIAVAPEDIAALGIEGYYNILYFCRFMLYLNSALNPILYNLMSSKFRTGFWRLIVSCCGDTEHAKCARNSTNYRDHRRPTEATFNGDNGDRKRVGRTLRREQTFLVNSISTSSSTDRTTSSTSYRSGSVSTSVIVQKQQPERRGAVGAAIIDITSGTVTSAQMYANGVSNDDHESIQQ